MHLGQGTCRAALELCSGSGGVVPTVAWSDAGEPGEGEEQDLNRRHGMLTAHGARHVRVTDSLYPLYDSATKLIGGLEAARALHERIIEGFGTFTPAQEGGSAYRSVVRLCASAVGVSLEERPVAAIQLNYMHAAQDKHFDCPGDPAPADPDQLGGGGGFGVDLVTANVRGRTWLVLSPALPRKGGSKQVYNRPVSVALAPGDVCALTGEVRAVALHRTVPADGEWRHEPHGDGCECCASLDVRCGLHSRAELQSFWKRLD